MRRWLGAGCALALIWVCAPSRSNAQTSSRTVNPAGASTRTKRVSRKRRAKASAAVHRRKLKYASVRRRGSRKTAARGQRKIDPERAQAIQEALIREHYLSGEASGTWNQASEDAMRRYQADHGWQSKTVPDARALISLGLGPSHDHLLNPDSAMTTGPDAPHAVSLTPVSRSADAGPHAETNSTSPADPPSAATPAPAPTPTPTPAPNHSSSKPQ
ncbi:MAG: peptidoglycan-binding domain-containing protein [Candidatus Sulfotelmatobacter sp.]